MNITARQRLLAIFVAALLAISLVPTWAFANDDSQGQQENPAEQVVAGEGGSAEAAAGESNGSGAAAGEADDGTASISDDDGVVGDVLGIGGVSSAAAAQAESAIAELSLGTGESLRVPLAGSEDAQISVSVSIVGPGENGEQSDWFSAKMEASEGDKASSVLEKALKDANLQATVYGSGESWYLSSIETPHDPKEDLGWNETTGQFWQVFVNGSSLEVGAGQYALSDGDTVTLAYSLFGDVAPGWVSASCKVIGVDSVGNKQVWANEETFVFPEGSTADELTEQFLGSSGLSANYEWGDYGWSLVSVTSPFDGRVLSTAQTESGWEYWQLFVDGEPSDLTANGVTLSSEAQTSVVWLYSSYGDGLPGADDVVLDPSATRSEVSSSWPSFVGGNANGAVTTAPTPTEATTAAWTYKYRTSGWATSDQVLVDGSVYVVSAGKLMKIDGETGELLASASVGSSCQYFCRLAYAEGLVIVPSDNGSLTAFTADTLACVWKTADLGNSKYQSNAPLTIADGYVYAGFVLGSKSEGGALVCVRISDGELMWKTETTTEETGAAEGYYWAGGVASGSELLVGGENGSVMLVSCATGAQLASINVGGPIRSNVIAAQVDASSGDGTYLVVTRDDGTLHKIRRQGNSLVEEGSVKFAATSTSTPAVSDGKVFVNGTSEGNYKTARGILVVIDLATLQIEKTVETELGQSQSSPLVSKQASGTYVYFTVNKTPGCVYAYKYGDDQAYQVFTPDKAQQEYCTASVICDEYGNLYYTNDSGYLFKLQGQPSWKVMFDTCGGSSLDAFYVAKGSTALQPTDPVRSGYTFAGWFADEACTHAWSFSSPVVSDITLYAKWNEIPPSAPSEGDAGSDTGGNGTGDGVSGGSAGGGLQGGTGDVLGGTVAPAAVPVASDGVAAGVDGDEADAAVKAEGDVALLSSESAATDARGVADGSAADEMASPAVWPYVVLGVGIVAALGAVGWFVAARRRGGVR